MCCLDRGRFRVNLVDYAALGENPNDHVRRLRNFFTKRARICWRKKASNQSDLDRLPQTRRRLSKIIISLPKNYSTDKNKHYQKRRLCFRKRLNKCRAVHFVKDKRQAQNSEHGYYLRKRRSNNTPSSFFCRQEQEKRLYLLFVFRNVHNFILRECKQDYHFER